MPENANREPPPICEDRIKIRLNVKTNRVMSSSIRNRLPGTIEKIVSDKVVSEIVIRTAAGEVTSVITTSSVQRMNLKEGHQVFAIIKATEVSVEKE
jgi:molybdopterin-binding protein